MNKGKNIGPKKPRPLGVVLSTRTPKIAISASSATSAVWTGGPDSQVPDSDQ